MAFNVICQTCNHCEHILTEFIPKVATLVSLEATKINMSLSLLLSFFHYCLKGKDTNHTPFFAARTTFNTDSSEQNSIFSENVKRATCSFKVHSENTALFHLLQLPPPGMIASSGPDLYTRPWAILPLHSRSMQPAAAIYLSTIKQLSSLGRTFPAVHKQSFVSPPQDTSSFNLLPSGHICSKGRCCPNKQGVYQTLKNHAGKTWL